MEVKASRDDFSSAYDKFRADQRDKFGGNAAPSREPSGRSSSGGPNPAPSTAAGGGGRGRFQPPFRRDPNEEPQAKKQRGHGSDEEKPRDPIFDDERLANLEEALVERILNEIMNTQLDTTWDDIAGLGAAKKVIQEVVVLPMLRPDLFTRLRAPPKGLLLFGPPGTGKTLIGKAIASQSGSTFFNISASSLTSKWVGDGEKLVRALFTVARIKQPSVIFVDEIDSMLCARSENDVESSRRIKTEFLVQMDGAGVQQEDRFLVIGATNRPQELDEAVRRRMVKRLYIPLPDASARQHLVSHLLEDQSHSLTGDQIGDIVLHTKGFSGADMSALCSEASMGPVRDISISEIRTISAQNVRPISHQDFRAALRSVRPSVSPNDLEQYVIWNSSFGGLSDIPELD